MSESIKGVNVTVTSCLNCPHLCSQAAKPGFFKATDFFCKYYSSTNLNDGIAIYEQNKHKLTTCPMLALSKGDFSMVDNMLADEQQYFEAIAWAYKKLDAYKVQNSGMENAMMMDRLMMIMGGFGGAKDGQ